MEVKGNLVMGQDGKPVCGILVSRDIDEFKKLSNALAKSRQRFQEIFEHSPIAIEVYDNDGKISKINPSCARLFGIKGIEEVSGFNLFEDPNLSDEMLAQVKREEETSYEVEFDFSKVPYKTSEKGKRNLEIRIRKVTAGDGIGYIAQIIDATKRKEAEMQLISTIAEKDKFMDIMAHDLKTPFNSILGFSELLATDYDGYDNDERRDMAFRIHSVSKNAFKLLETLLEHSRVHSGKYDVPATAFKLGRIIDEEISKLETDALKKRVRIKNSVEPSTQVKANELLVGRIVQNLLTNAIKFSQPGGEIHISASASTGGMAQISVADQGVGIEKGRMKYLFDVCQENVSTPGTLGEKGTGFGLPLVAFMAEKNGGKIWVESEIGKGSTFTFTLPLA